MKPIRLNPWVLVPALLLSLWTCPTQGAQRVGVIQRIWMAQGVLMLEVTLLEEQAQPTNPDLSTGVPLPSQIMAMTADATEVRVGMPASLLVEKAGAVWTPSLGTVTSLADATHCVVEVERGALDKSWQDPSDQNNVHRAADYLVVGATVAVMETVEQPSVAKGK